MASNQVRYRSWCFTINNPQKLTDEQQNRIKENLSDMRYYVIGKETGAEGTPHWQGFLYAKNPIRMNTVKTILLWTDSKAHIEYCKGTSIQNIAYCKKGEQPHAEWEELYTAGPNYGKNADFDEYGESPATEQDKGAKGAEAQKRKWSGILTDAKEGKWRKLEEEYPREYLSCFRTLHTLRASTFNVTSVIQGELEHEWLHGISGAGKSSRARRENPNLYLKDVDGDTAKWWDMYDGEEVVLIEDLSPFNRSLTDALKKWSDRYPFKAQVKGGYMQIRPRKIVVTSQYTIDQIWEDAETRAALHRRFIEIEVDSVEEMQARLEAIHNNE